MRSASPSPENPSVPEVRARILRQARAALFTRGYTGFTMDDLATELGVSKKTLYVHFSGKDEIVGAVIDDIGHETRVESERILGNRDLDFAEKLHAFVASVLQRLATLDPRTLRDLQRFAPPLFARLDEMRRKNLPFIFGQLIEEGQAAKHVRADISPPFAIEFFLQAMQGIMQGATLEQLRLAPHEAIARGIDLFFCGLLTPAGRKHYEKLFPR